jgi:RND family efflux transporter MFP subunit
MNGSSLLLITVMVAIVCAWFLRPPAGLAADNAPVAEIKTLYTCGMHPQVIQDHPGNCPICGMKLTPIRKQTTASPSPAATGERKIKYFKSTMMPGEVRQTPGKDSMGMEMVPVYDEPSAESSVISIDPVTTQNMNLRTGLVTRGPLRRAIRTVAVIDYDETSLADVTTKFKGWITKLYASATGQLVHEGDPLFEVYSPELYSAQAEYLLALENATGRTDAQGMKSDATTRLKYFDISDDQIAELEKTRQIKKSLRINAPRDGIVVEKDVIEGQMVDAGMNLYRLADLSLVWVQAQVYEQDLPFIKLGQEATVALSYLTDRKFVGRVTYIYPWVDEKTRTAKVRMEFHNPGYFLKPGMFATAEFTSELEPSALLVPDSAILRSGEKNTVFVALDGGRFEPRTVALGPRSENNMYQVLSGLFEGERVVTSGQFMLDSESQLREAIQKMTAAGSAMKQETPVASTAPESPPVSEETVSAYVCPMPEHVSIEYQHPGKCPICGMTLVPATADLLAGIRPESTAAYYSCPMPAHADVHMDKAGKCPKCGMTLIPVFQKPAGAAVTNTSESHEMMHHP